jgi:hypothetical protein
VEKARRHNMALLTPVYRLNPDKYRVILIPYVGCGAAERY